MGLFDFLKPNANAERSLCDSIQHNADIIEKSEGKDRKKAEYLSICTLLDDLRPRERGEEGRRLTMVIVARDYPHLLNDVVRYSEWASGKLQLSPTEEAVMATRHSPSPSATSKGTLSTDDLKAQMDLCASRISDKWIFFNQTMKFRPEVPLVGIIENFAIPVQEFVKNTYPALYAGGPKMFWMVMFLGLARSGVPSKEVVNRAIAELEAKFRKGE